MAVEGFTQTETSIGEAYSTTIKQRYVMVMYVDNLSNAFTFPYVPPETVTLAESQNTEQFDSQNASYSTPGLVQPLTLKWEGLLPNKKLSWCNDSYDPDPVALRKWIRKYRQKFKVFTVIITTADGKTLLNSRYTITKASFTPLQNGDFEGEFEFEFCKKIPSAYPTMTQDTSKSSTSSTSSSSSSSSTTTTTRTTSSDAAVL